jgi:hemolysin III
MPEAYSPTEEIAHSLTAAVGVASMLLGIPWLVARAAENSGAWRVIGALAFGCGAVMMFATSTFYHAARRPAVKAWLRRLDHSAIYLLIAGTYTPFTIGVIGGSLGWSLFGIVWGLALLGVTAKLSGGMLGLPWLSTLLYVVIGWIGIVAGRELWNNLTAMQFGWMVAGGLCYTGGVPFYLWKRRRYTHVVWHLFVLAGVACHFVAVLSLISAPARAESPPQVHAAPHNFLRTPA